MKENILCLLLCSCFIGCIETYDCTFHLCDRKLYVEKFITPVGMDAEYLTDSLNFRIFIGKRDDEHENFTYICEGDSLFIKKIDSSEEKWRYLDARTFSLKDLKANKTKKVFE